MASAIMVQVIIIIFVKADNIAKGSSNLPLLQNSKSNIQTEEHSNK